MAERYESRANEAGAPALPALTRLSQRTEGLTQPGADVRGARVLDRDDAEVGTVDDLLVDDAARKVRFLNVKSGGFLGFGGVAYLIPVDVIARMDADGLHLAVTRDVVSAGPSFDPGVAAAGREVYEGVCRHFGCAPFWAPEYVYPSLDWPR